MGVLNLRQASTLTVSGLMIGLGGTGLAGWISAGLVVVAIVLVLLVVTSFAAGRTSASVW